MIGPLAPATSATTTDGASPGETFILARLARRSIAMPMASLLEIADLGEVASVPLAPDWLVGITNVRGVVVPVVDLAVLLGWSGEATGRRALVVRDGRFRLALPVQSVHVVRWLASVPDGPATDPITESRSLARELQEDTGSIWIVDAEAVLARVRQGELAGMAGR